ncbi:hypothetical protein [Haloarchaeobius sp. DFWS5]|uniref:hypothetical protein n=1 Tax=Haloarchaeobius sp. DFWS5 TaxID=3446114 RepID=UPI003EB7F479
MKRREVCSSLGLVLFAGCSSLGDEGNATEAPEPTAATTADTTTGTSEPACDPGAVVRPTPDDPSSGPSPPGYPDKPSELTTNSVEEYVRTFEHAYAVNDVLVDQTVETIDTEQRQVTVESVDGGFLVHGDTQVMYTKEGSGTRTTHGDVKHHFNYFVGESAVYRVESNMEDEDPRTSDVRALVECTE